MSRTWWYVLVGGFGARQMVFYRKVSRHEAVQSIAYAHGRPVGEVEQCWAFDKEIDVYHKSWDRE